MYMGLDQLKFHRTSTQNKKYFQRKMTWAISPSADHVSAVHLMLSLVGNAAGVLPWLYRALLSSCCQLKPTGLPWCHSPHFEPSEHKPVSLCVQTRLPWSCLIYHSETNHISSSHKQSLWWYKLVAAYLNKSTNYPPAGLLWLPVPHHPWPHPCFCNW